ncbi:hypothetical protein Taro_006602 [Colocasia esculenta]|uniref:Uncharacterized protein n=1 Tax=Colocasia esculenta TaxID=4460 RepID=A0A843TXU3_COLES|nr:hypothetical protein [Colocasia esculenta]
MKGVNGGLYFSTTYLFLSVFLPLFFFTFDIVVYCFYQKMRRLLLVNAFVGFGFQTSSSDQVIMHYLLLFTAGDSGAHIIDGGAAFELLAAKRSLTAAIVIMRQRILLTLKGSSGMIFRAMKCKRSYARCVALNKMSSKYALTVVCVWENISVQHASYLMMISQRDNTTAMVVEFAELVVARISSTVLNVVGSSFLCNFFLHCKIFTIKYYEVIVFV